MADQPRRPRTLNDARSEAEAAFKRTTAKVAEAPPKPPPLPGVRELVSLRIDQDVLEYFQEGGPGWQDRINEALAKGRGQIERRARSLDLRSARNEKGPGSNPGLFLCASLRR